MDSDEPTGWPGEGHGGEEDSSDLGASQDDGLSDAGMAYDDEAADPDPDVTADDGLGGYDLESEAAGGESLPDDPAEPAGFADDADSDEPAAADPVPGTDPDADPLADDASWQADPFPQSLDLQPPEPVDGMPWSDPATLGDAQLASPVAGSEGSPPVADLYAHDGAEPPADESEAWASLAGSEDPATSSLARFWAPGGQG